jgi:hypothetical protein
MLDYGYHQALWLIAEDVVTETAGNGWAGNDGSGPAQGELRSRAWFDDPTNPGMTALFGTPAAFRSISRSIRSK